MDNLFSLNTIVIIFLILFPGIIVRRSFYSDKFSKQFYRGQFSERLITTIFWGIVNALIGLLITFIIVKLFYINGCLSCSIQNKIKNIIEFDITKTPFLINDFSLKYLVFIILFVFNLFVLPAILGRRAFVIIRKFKLDLRYPFLSFSNHWHYFFSGEVLAKSKHESLSNGIDFRKNKNFFPVVDLLTVEGDKKYLYKGILVDYNLKDQNEELESLVLFKALKKIYDKDIIGGEKQDLLTFERIPGNIISIPYSTVLNINVSLKELNNQSINSAETVNTVINEREEIREKPAKQEKNDSVAGCGILILVPALFFLAAHYSKDISYFRFLLGLIGTLTFTSALIMKLQNLSKKFKVSKMFWFILLLLFFSAYYLWVFNIYTFKNPISF